MNDIDTQRIKSDRGEIVTALESAGVSLKGNVCRCPFHDDKHASAGIYESEGVWRFKCQTVGCAVCEDVFGLREKLGGPKVADQFREIRQNATAAPKQRFTVPASVKEYIPRAYKTIEAMISAIGSYHKIEDHYRYTNPDTGAVDMVTIRIRQPDGGKTFKTCRSVPGGFTEKAPPKPWPLFNRTAIRDSAVVIHVEGEKCVKALRAVGYVASASPCGAVNAESADWTPLAGKTVYLWPDFDKSGAEYMASVFEILQKVVPPPMVYMIDVAELGLPEKSDVVEFLESYAGTEEQTKYAIDAVLACAIPMGPSTKVHKLIADTISGKRSATPWPWPGLDKATNALLPGTVTTMCGDPGSAKSFWLLQAAIFWQENKIPFALYQLEADEDGSHLLRALVQKSGRMELLDWKWIRDNGSEAKQIANENNIFLDDISRSMWTPPGEIPELMELVAWVEARAKEGRRVIAIDPVTAASTSKQRWEDDRKFVLQTMGIMRKYGSSLILVTHPKLNSKGTDNGLSDVAGGAAWTRFTQTVLRLRMHEPPKDFMIRGEMDYPESAINRTIRIDKARHGFGAKWEIAYRFGSGMTFKEVGAVSKKKKEDGDE